MRVNHLSKSDKQPGNNAGNQQAFAHLDDGDLQITGVVGGGTLAGNCWITPQSFSPIGQE